MSEENGKPQSATISDGNGNGKGNGDGRSNGSDVAPTPAAHAPARRGSGVAAFALLLAAASLGWQGWQAWQQRGDAGQSALAQDAQARLAAEVRQLDDRQQALTASQARLDGEFDSLRTRFSESQRTARSLREEVLGVGERASLLEDTVARLAERRMEGQAALRLDEAELLLRMAHERQRLFQDRDGALAALELADNALAGIDSAQLINLRQTLRREMAELAAAPTVDVAALARRIDDLRSTLPRLPEARPKEAVENSETESPSLLRRLGSALGEIVTVRRIGAEADAERFPVDARRASLALEIALLRAALAARDDAAWERGNGRLAQLLASGFDEGSSELASARQLVAELAAARLRPAAAAPQLALRELRNLRTLRSLGREASAPGTRPDDDPPDETEAESETRAPAEEDGQEMGG